MTVTGVYVGHRLLSYRAWWIRICYHIEAPGEYEWVESRLCIDAFNAKSFYEVVL